MIAFEAIFYWQCHSWDWNNRNGILPWRWSSLTDTLTIANTPILKYGFCHCVIWKSHVPILIHLIKQPLSETLKLTYLLHTLLIAHIYLFINANAAPRIGFMTMKGRPLISSFQLLFHLWQTSFFREYINFIQCYIPLSVCHLTHDGQWPGVMWWHNVRDHPWYLLTKCNQWCP